MKFKFILPGQKIKIVDAGKSVYVPWFCDGSKKIKEPLLPGTIMECTKVYIRAKSGGWHAGAKIHFKPISGPTYDALTKVFLNKNVKVLVDQRDELQKKVKQLDDECCDWKVELYDYSRGHANVKLEVFTGKYPSRSDKHVKDRWRSSTHEFDRHKLQNEIAVLDKKIKTESKKKATGINIAEWDVSEVETWEVEIL